jgi:putative peptidoglycan lipid II flippase
MLILVGFFGQAVGVASYPFLARLAVQNKMEEMNHLINTTLRYLALVIPFSVLMMVLRHEIIRILFQRGQFDPAATAATAGVLVFIMIGAFAFAAQTVVVRGYFAIQNTLFPAIYGTLAAVLSLPLYYFGMQFMGAAGIGLAVSLAAIFQVTLLYVLWNRKTHNPQSRDLYYFIFKIIWLSLILGVSLEGFRQLALTAVRFAGISEITFSGSLITCMATGLLFAALFVFGGHAMGIREISDILNRIAGKLMPKRRTSP